MIDECNFTSINFEILYKHAESMVVCDSLSRRPVHTFDSTKSSPNENDPYFPYVLGPVNKILLPNESNLQEVICSKNQLKRVNYALIALPSLSHMQTTMNPHTMGILTFLSSSIIISKIILLSIGKQYGKSPGLLQRLNLLD